MGVCKVHFVGLLNRGPGSGDGLSQCILVVDGISANDGIVQQAPLLGVDGNRQRHHGCRHHQPGQFRQVVGCAD